MLLAHPLASKHAQGSFTAVAQGGWAIDAERRAVIFDAALASQKRMRRHFFGRGRAASATASPTFVQKTKQPALRLARVP